MTSSKLFSIPSFFAAKPLTIAKKRKPQVIEIGTDEVPDEAVILAYNAGTKKDNRLVDVVSVVEKPTGNVLDAQYQLTASKFQQ